MSRVQRKKIERRSRIYFKICMFLMISLLIYGLLTVDLSIRKILAIDESSLIDYRQLGDNQYIVHIMGKDHFINTKVLRSQINNKFAEFGEIAYNIREWIENKW